MRTSIQHMIYQSADSHPGAHKYRRAAHNFRVSVYDSVADIVYREAQSCDDVMCPFVRRQVKRRTLPQIAHPVH